MSHQDWIERVELSLYGELTEADHALLDEHLASCPACRAERASMEQLHAVLGEAPQDAPTRALLSEARRELRLRLSRERSGNPASEWLRGLFRTPAASRTGMALGGLALVAAGVLIGTNWGTNWSPRRAESAPAQAAAQQSQSLGGDTRITNVRFITSDPSTGEIEFAFEAIKPVRMKGHINDEQIQRVLSHAIMNEQNVGVRLASISAVSSTRALPDKEIKNALIAALESDENAGVRAEAMKALRGYAPDEEIRDALLFVLTHDKNPALRITAINSLDSTRTSGQVLDENMLNILRQSMNSDNNNYIRLRARTVMEDHRQ